MYTPTFKYSKNNFTDHIVNAHFSKGLVCPDCECPEAIKYGKYKNTQRYRCCACGRTFTYKTNTFMARTHNVEKWSKYIECFKKGLTIRECAKIVGISVPTAFSWRHRLMDAIKPETPERFVGTTEVIDKHFRVCEKGNKNLHRSRWKRGSFSISPQYRNKLILAMDRYGNMMFKLINSYSLTEIELTGEFFKLLQSASNIMTENTSEIRDIANKLKIIRINNQQLYNHNEQPCDSNMIRSKNYFLDLFMWLERFHGVATKYLEKYIKWYNLTMTKFDITCHIIQCMI